MIHTLPLRDVLDLTDWRNLRFGLRPSLPSFPDFHSLAGVRASEADAVLIREHYNNVLVTPDAQTLGSCPFNAFTGLLEWHIHRTHLEIVQLDYDRCYREFREYRGNMRDTGAFIDEPFSEALRTGIVPKTSSIQSLNPSATGINIALADGPCVVGMSIHEGWAPHNLHATSGAVNEALDRNLAWGDQGHAMLLVAVSLVDGNKAAVFRQSWGPIGYRNLGLVTCSLHHLFHWAITPFVSFDPGPDWKKWRGWEQYAV